VRGVKERIRVECELIRGCIVSDARVVVGLHWIVRLSVLKELVLILILILIECRAVDLIESIATADVAVVVRVISEMRIARWILLDPLYSRGRLLSSAEMWRRIEGFTAGES